VHAQNKKGALMMELQDQSSIPPPSNGGRALNEMPNRDSPSL
jgi:hypothetical protein